MDLERHVFAYGTSGRLEDLAPAIREIVREEIRAWIIEQNRRAFEHDSSKSIGQVTAVLEDEQGIDFDVDFNEVRIEGEQETVIRRDTSWVHYCTARESVVRFTNHRPECDLCTVKR